jgi:hypothetical protein
MCVRRVLRLEVYTMMHCPRYLFLTLLGSRCCSYLLMYAPQAAKRRMADLSIDVQTGMLLLICLIPPSQLSFMDPFWVSCRSLTELNVLLVPSFVELRQEKHILLRVIYHRLYGLL